MIPPKRDPKDPEAADNSEESKELEIPERGPSYSADEMMRRLRESDRARREKEDSEVITRADGTKVVRVRRRKRRSNQEAEKKKVSAKQKAIGVVILAVLVMAGLGAGVLIWVKLNTESFLEEVRASVSQKAKTRLVKLSDVRIMPTVATSSQSLLAWPNGSLIRRFQGKKVECHVPISAFFTNKWGGSSSSFEAKEGILSLGGENVEGDLRGFKSISGTGLPKFDLDRYRCEKLSILFGGSSNSSRMKLEETRFSLQKEDKREFLATCRGGMFQAEGWGSMKLERATMRLYGEHTEIISVQLKKAGGRAKLKGDYYYDSSVINQLNLSTEELSTETFFSKALSRIFKTQITTEEGVLTFKSRDYNSYRLEVPFKSSEARLAALPFLHMLRDYFAESEYVTPIFKSVVKGKIIKTANKITISDLHLEELGMMIVEGNISSERGNLSGELQVGIPASKLPIVRNAVKLMKGQESRGGYNWLTVSLGGTIERPESFLGREGQLREAKWSDLELEAIFNSLISRRG